MQKTNKSELFDSWATRFGALAILTAAQQVFEDHDSARTGIFLGVCVLSISCFSRVCSWSYLALLEMLSYGVLKFFTIGLKDFSVAISLLLSTIAITFFDSPYHAELATDSAFWAMETFVDYMRIATILVIIPASVLIIIAYPIVQWWKKTR